MRSRALHAGTAVLAIAAAAVPIGLFSRGPAVKIEKRFEDWDFTNVELGGDSGDGQTAY